MRSDRRRKTEGLFYDFGGKRRPVDFAYLLAEFLRTCPIAHVIENNANSAP
jgi:hypothetical protein